jgi:hypothetical protein
LEGNYSETYWYAGLTPGVVKASAESLECALQRFTGELHAFRRFFRRVREEGGRTEFYVGVHGPASYGFELEPVLLSELGSIGIALSLEMFPVPQRPTKLRAKRRLGVRRARA